MSTESPKYSRSRMSRRLAGLLVLVLAILGLTATGATAGTPNCASTYTCWWANTNFDGTYYGSAMDQISWPSAINSNDDSVQNNGTSGNAIFTYRYAYYIEVMYCVRKGVAVSVIPSAKANRGSSHQWKIADSGCY